jgi:RNA polymerase sigma-70 factor (ECF subfamily)
MVNEMVKEQIILEKLQKQKSGALDEAIEQYTPYVSVIVYNIIGRVMTREDVEEVVSSVFISLWRHSAGFDGDKGSVRSYLGATARNHAKNKLRELRPQTSIEEFETSLPAVSGEPQTELEQRERSSILWDMVHELGEPDSEIFLRYYYYEEKIKHIDKCMDLCVATVKTKLARGRQKLKEKILKSEVNIYE